MAILRSLGGTSLTTRSAIEMVPSLISSRPANMRRLVDLPQPEGPTKTRNSLSGISRLRLFTAVTLPYRLTTFSNVTDAMTISPWDGWGGNDYALRHNS